MNRDDAIAWLRAVGWDARPRDWVLGETIVVPIGQARTHNGVEYFPNAVYLCPEIDGSWSLLDLARPTNAQVAATYPDLNTAVREADAYARRLAPDPDDDEDDAADQPGGGGGS